MTSRARATGSSLPRECITVIFMKTVTINSCGELVTAGHGTRGIGFKYGKMKGLKISPPQSMARIDHTSFLCANEASLPYPSAYLSTIRSLSYLLSPLPLPHLLAHPSPSSSFPVRRRPFTLTSISGRFAQHAILQAARPPRARCTCVLSRRFASRPGNVAFTRFP